MVICILRLIRQDKIKVKCNIFILLLCLLFFTILNNHKSHDIGNLHRKEIAPRIDGFLKEHLFAEIPDSEQQQINDDMAKYTFQCRISEIEVYPRHLEEYKTMLKQEAEASIRLAAGVIAIFPMFQQDNPTQVRILEIYMDPQAYQSHLETRHFLKYKTSTLHMVKSLKLVDMDALDLEMASHIFIKLKNKPHG